MEIVCDFPPADLALFERFRVGCETGLRDGGTDDAGGKNRTMTQPDTEIRDTYTACPNAVAFAWGKMAGCNWAIVRHHCPGATLPTAATLPDSPSGDPLTNCPAFGLLRVLAGPDDGLSILAEGRHLVSPVAAEHRPAFAHGLLVGAREGLRLPAGWRGL